MTQTLTERFANNEVMKQKAAAYDAEQARRAQEQLYAQGANDGMAKLIARQREQLAEAMRQDALDKQQQDQGYIGFPEVAPQNAEGLSYEAARRAGYVR